MSFVKLNGGARVALATLAILVASSQVARADTIFLQCDTHTYTIDLTNDTVDNHPATINPTAIDWQTTQDFGNGGSAINYNHIDRTAGTARYGHTVHFPNGVVKDLDAQTASCTKVSAPPTKF
jgi:hypothetical protein